jgi:hypothetical protein
MGTESLNEIIAELDNRVPKEGALIRVAGDDVYEEGEPILVGNRTGYLRLGIELLKLADAPPTARNPDRVEADLTGILDSTAHEVKVAAFDRRENIRPQLEELSVNGSEYGAARFLVPLGALLIGTLLLVGLYHSAIWFWHVLVH